MISSYPEKGETHAQTLNYEHESANTCDTTRAQRRLNASEALYVPVVKRINGSFVMNVSESQQVQGRCDE